jgi:hypothetical protein
VNSRGQDQAAPVEHPSNSSTGLAGSSRDAEATALHRLETSRHRIQATMAKYAREIAPPSDPSRSAPQSLGQRLLERAQRLPVIRTALAIRSLRRD